MTVIPVFAAYIDPQQGSPLQATVGNAFNLFATVIFMGALCGLNEVAVLLELSEGREACWNPGSASSDLPEEHEAFLEVETPYAMPRGLASASWAASEPEGV